MNLPVPSATEVAEFQALYEAKFGIKLRGREALTKCTDLCQLVFICGNKHGRPKVCPVSSQE